MRFSPFALGMRDALPFVIVVVPFAMLFGLVASEAGWTIGQIMAMSVLVIAGASQFTAIQLMQDNAPLLVVIAAALAVNLRLAMYSASLAVHLGPAPLWQRATAAYFLVDQTYGCAIGRYATTPMNVRQKMAYFAGSAVPMAPVWYGFTWFGAVAGQAVPEGLAIDFAVPVMFLALAAPMLRDRPAIAATIVAIVLSVLLAGLPYALGVLVAGAAAMATGAGLEAAGEAGPGGRRA